MADEESDTRSGPRALSINAGRRAARYAEGREAGARWMVEAVDLWDWEDDDGGVYFVHCADEAEVDRFCEASARPSSVDRVVGIYSLDEPLEAQGPGIAVEAWRTGLRRRR